jgi:hypothetical protein
MNQLPLLTGSTTNASGTSNSTTTQSPSTLGTIGQIAGTAANLASLFSDRRLKRDVLRLGRIADGIGLYLYRYLWSPAWRIGVMAQEVLAAKPEAALEHASGFLMVNYGAL